MKKKIIYMSFVTTFLIPNTSFTYLEQRSGKIIPHTILGFIATAFNTVSFQWNSFKNLINKILIKIEKYRSE